MGMSHQQAQKWKAVREAVSGGWGSTLRYALIAAVAPSIATGGAILLLLIR